MVEISIPTVTEGEFVAELGCLCGSSLPVIFCRLRNVLFEIVLI